MTAALTACDQIGESGVAAELRRVKGFALVEQTRDKAEIVAQGQKLWIAASKGFCIAPDSIEVTGQGIVAVIADCIDAEVMVTPTATGGTIELPPSFPGVTTVSVTGKRGLKKASSINDIRALEAFLETEQGRQLLGRSRQSESMEIREMRRIGEALYVHVYDTSGDSLGIFAPDFWRVFLPIRGRLVLITVNGFAARPLDNEDMMGFLATQVVQLHMSNGSRASKEEFEIAAAVEGRFDAQTGPISLAELELDDGTAPKKAPKPVIRPVRVASGSGQQTAEAGSPFAPARAPQAPARPS
ncbi:MAG: hypothetical protein AAGH74_04440 [Pseudomonadota bacterium]